MPSPPPPVRVAGRPELLVVAPVASGHHAEYLRWIVQGLRARGIGHLAVAAHPALREAEAEALAGTEAIPLPSLGRLAAAGSLWATGRATGALVHDAIRAARAPRVFLPYLDHTQLALASGLRFGFEVRLSGILFRATPHESPVGLRGRARQLRKATLLRLAARNPHLGPVLALDPDAVGPLRRVGLDARWLPDPVAPPAPTRSAAAVRRSLGVAEGRRMLLLFGSLEERKGVFEVLGALQRLPPEATRRLAVVIVGRTPASLRPRLEAAVAAARQTEAQVLFEARFVPDAELDDLVTAADVVLAPYRGHVGSSGVVLRAAAAGTPLVATSEAMVGREVRRHRLGQAVDPADPPALAAALGRVADDPTTGFDGASAAAYAEAHSVGRFSEVIHRSLFPDAR